MRQRFVNVTLIALVLTVLGLIVGISGARAVSFAPLVNYGIRAMSPAVTIGDFNGDGRQDIVTADNGSGTRSVLPGIGDGTFEPSIDTAVAAGIWGPRAVISTWTAGEIS